MQQPQRDSWREGGVRSLAARAAAAKQALRDPVHLAALLDLAVRREGAGTFVACPWHGPERTPSCSLRVHEDGIGVKCFGCGRGGTALDLIAAVRGLQTYGAGFAALVEAAEELAGVPMTFAPRMAARAARREPPPRDEMEDFWARCVSVLEDREVVSWLRTARRIDPEVIDLSDVARAVPPWGPLPRWARGPGGPWSTSGHRLVLRAFDAHGRLSSLHARAVRDVDPRKKELVNVGGGGGVFADPAGRLLLAEGRLPDGCTTVIITEGGPDFLTTVSVRSDADEQAPAVLGLYNGAWTREIAGRIPLHARVVLALHGDAAGAEYAAAIEETLPAHELREVIVPSVLARGAQ